MHTKNFTLITGLVMLMMGLIAFLQPLNVSEGLPPLIINLSYGMFLDIFPMNIFNKITLIFFGALGVFAYMNAHHSFHYSIIFSRTVFWVMGALCILGLFPESNTLWGYWPLFGFEIIVHGTFSLMGWYYGYIAVKDEIANHNHKFHKA